MGSFYEIAFPDVSFNITGDTQVRCPFPHKDASGEEYNETRASMSIDISKGIHHCFACGAKGNEIEFIKQYKKINEEKAIKLKQLLDSSQETMFEWQRAINTLNSNPQILDMIKSKYHFSENAIEKLQLGVETAGKGVSFPVFLYGRLVDVIAYNPENPRKYMKRPNSQNGIIMPYESWLENHKATIIVAGQKDLGIALTHNLNAIAITGGEGEIPELFLSDFQDRNVYIVFDNDDTGKRGAEKVAMAIQPYAKRVSIVDISETCIEKGEDLWDYFVKYKKSRTDFVKLLKTSKTFTEKEAAKVKERIYPTVTLSEAMKKRNFDKILRSTIQVLGTAEEKFIMPLNVVAEKKYLAGDSKKDTLKVGDKVTWEFTPLLAKQLFYLIDNNLKEDKITANLKRFLKIPTEYGMVLKHTRKEAIYKCTIADYFETTNIDDTIIDFTAYSIKNKLESGKKYKITYKLIPHPLLGQSVHMIILDAEEAETSVSRFEVNERSIEILKQFQRKETETIKEVINMNVQKFKGFVNADYNEQLIETIDLGFHTPLKFRLGESTLRAYLDTLIVTESRIGKTTSVQAAQAHYGVGSRIPLNGKNASIAGLVGGSHKTKNGFQIRAGLIPRTHKGLIIFEELGKASKDILTEITDIRTSGTATITRVSGSTRLPAFVRMLTLTNTKLNGTAPRSISSYPNGIEILVDLVGTAEDIARYDTILILGEKGEQPIDPFFKAPTPFPDEWYKTRIRWIWSRKPEEVIVTKEVYQHAVKLANKANKDLNSHIKIFGTEAWLKIIRLAIAVAGYTISTDDTYKNIIVTKDHIDYAYEFIINLYDNKTFKLREYVTEQRKFVEIDEEGIELLQNIWGQSPGILTHLENHSTTSTSTIKTVANLDQDNLNRIMSELTGSHMIQHKRYDIYPTERFRKGMACIDRKSDMRVLIID